MLFAAGEPSQGQGVGGPESEPALVVSKPLVNLLAHLRPQKTVLLCEEGRCLHADATAELHSVGKFCEAVFDAR